MAILDQLERKASWLTFPKVIRYLAIFKLLVLGLTFLNSGITRILDFDLALILKGELWRAITFIFCPVGSLQGSMGGIVAIFGMFAALFLMTIGDGLEEAWGEFRTSLFFYLGVFSALVASFTFGFIGLPFYNLVSPGLLVDASILFAFAVMYPKYPVMLMLIIPMPIFILAILAGVMLLGPVLGLAMNFGVFYGFAGFLYFSICLVNFFIFAGFKWKERSLVKGHKEKFKKVIQPEKKAQEAFYTCSVCKKTDVSNPELSFRVLSDGNEICENCLDQQKSFS